MASVSFRSKVDWWLRLVLLAAAAASIVALVSLALTESPLQALAFSPVLLLSVVLPVWLMSSTTYTLDAEELLVRSGPLTWHVPLRDIHGVRATRNPLSSPALSLDRVRIDYGDHRAIMISPDDKARFLEELHRRMPGPMSIPDGRR